MKKTTFLENGQFYKGNIHCHTTCSDGKLSPDAIVKAYQDKGYDFLAITDHNVFSHYTCYDTDRFVMIQGVEGNLRAPADNHREYHFIVLPGPATDMSRTKAISSIVSRDRLSHLRQVNL